MSSPYSRRLLARLHKDLAELLDDPYPGVTVFTDDKNFRELCLVLTPPSGPWKDLSLHFAVSLPEDWPARPPSVLSSVHGIEHPNLYGSYICCDLLKPHYDENYAGGYSPALTLRGLFLQFLTFFSSTKVEQDYGGVVDIGDSVTTTYWDDAQIAERLTSNSVSYAQGPFQAQQKSLEGLWARSREPILKQGEYGSDNPTQHSTRLTTSGRVHRLTTRNPRWAGTLQAVKHWSCSKCPYGSPALPHVRDAVPTPKTQHSTIPAASSPKDKCLIDDLNDDCLLEIATHVPSETLITLSQAYPRFARLSQAHHLALRSQLRCFFLRTSLHECTLGVGIKLDPMSRSLSSDFDWLSQEAFDTYRVRKSIQKRTFDFWIPLAFNVAHFNSARSEIWTRLAEIDQALEEAERAMKERQANGRRPGQGASVRKPNPPVVATRVTAAQASPALVKVIFKLMNNIVVALMKSCTDEFQGVQKADIGRDVRHDGRHRLLHASEQAVISYCHLFHLATSICRSYPKVLESFTLRLREFVMTPDSRLKARTPDIGELIVMLSVVMTLSSFDGKTPITWERISGSLLQEAIIRNARWILQASPELEAMEDEGCDVQGPLESQYRLKTSFNASKTSLRLLMFQATFLSLFGGTYGPEAGCDGIKKLDENYGFPEEALPGRMVEAIKDIYKVSTWTEFFGRVNFAAGVAWTGAKFSGILRDSMRTSASRGYHTPATGLRMSQLIRNRRGLDPSFRKPTTRAVQGSFD